MIRITDEPANAFGDPVKTMAPTESSLSASAKASFSSTNRGLLKAFNACGRLRVMRATEGSGREVRMKLNCEDIERIVAASALLGRVKAASLKEARLSKVDMVMDKPR